MLALWNVVRWIGWWLVASQSPPVSSGQVNNNQRRLCTVSNSDQTGLPAKWFSDEELLGCRVRLVTDQDLGHGYRLHRGERFVVVATARKLETRGSGLVSERFLCLTNHRAKAVPVRGVACELLFDWPASMEGKKTDGNGR